MSEKDTYPSGTVSFLRLLPVVVPVLLFCLATSAAATPRTGVQVGRIDHVADGDTVDLTNGQKVRLVQIDTPEVYFTPECYGKQASALTKRLLPPGTLVRLLPEPATDLVDQYGRILRYVVRVRDGLDVNLQLRPGRRRPGTVPLLRRAGRGRYAARSSPGLPSTRRHIASRLWGACRGTPYDPDRGVDSGAVNGR